MCGIAGIVNKKDLISDSIQLDFMIRAVAHRGPDGEGTLIEGNIGLGHRRLSIIDLSEDGYQPMTNRDKSLTIVFNGEIYNYLELKEELSILGQSFDTATDTEVILAGYIVWGDQCVSHFNGMWSFVILDRTCNKLFCSRDRFGVKPFYFVETSDVWCFGSEIRQLLPFCQSVKANIRVVKEFLFAGISEPLEETFFDGVRKLPGGHNLTYCLESNSYQIKNYYTLKINKVLGNIGLDEAVKIFGDQFSSAISLRLRADVTVGTCLSGGLDSSSISTLAAVPYIKERGEPFRAITSISELISNDESAFAQQVVEFSEMEWLSFMPTYDDFAKNIKEVVRAQEEPFGGPSICMQYFVMKSAQLNGISVLLDGQGGDETLLGYERYLASYFLHILRTRGLTKAIKAMIDCGRNNTKVSPIKILLYSGYFSSARLRYLNYSYRNRYLRKIPPLSEGMKTEAKGFWKIQAMQKGEITSHLPHLLRFEDKNAMWHSVETRLPFLDYRLVETALSLPVDSKINRGWTKYVLRLFMDGKMPSTITWRKNKIGFEAPEKPWLKLHSSIMLQEVLSSKLLSTICELGILEKIFLKLDTEICFRLYEVALWEKEFKIKI